MAQTFYTFGGLEVKCVIGSTNALSGAEALGQNEYMVAVVSTV